VLSVKFVPLGWLSLFPLHAAWIDAPEMPGGRYYTLDAVNFAYAPSAKAVATARRLAQNVISDRLLLVVEPIPVAAARLPHATEEAKQVLAGWNDGERITRWRASATYEEVHEQLSRATVFHFDGHAFAGWSDPLAGGLLLANNRVLSVADLQEMQLEIRLAVLSACETGVVGTSLPDEVIGLPAALMQAGTAGVVASLWSVADQSTALLMAAFYRYWKQEGLTPVAALRQAQLQLRQNPDFAHPFYWAAFTYTGA
jgi:CHAT domain-containing protein